MTDGRCEVLNFWREKVLIKMKRGGPQYLIK
jgi:hypothetical protein